MARGRSTRTWRCARSRCGGGTSPAGSSGPPPPPARPRSAPAPTPAPNTPGPRPPSGAVAPLEPTARRACAAVLEGLLAAGGMYRQVAVQPPSPGEALRCSDGSTLAGDVYVFACGPWLGKLFPEVIGDRVRATRQEVFFFGTPPGDARFTEEALPVWADHANHFMYGIPGNEWRGFKVADDARGPAFDPTAGERVPSPEAPHA